MSTEVPEMYRSSPTLKELSKLPQHVLAQELLHMAERAENSSTKNFLHYKFMPDNAALELGVHTLLSQGFRLNEKQSTHLASVCEDDDTDEVLDDDDCIFDFDDDADDEYAEEDKIPQLMPALAFSPELSHNLDGDGPLHRLIIGDNYHALAGLQASLATHPDGVYDLIYIDPPYNTGKGFTYNDNNVDPDDPWRSTKWASMMEPRLRLAHRLMKDTGVIFLSIDDNELYSLKLLCDSVFGRRNFIANLVWQGSGKNNADFTSGGVDYMLVYAKNVDSLRSSGVEWRDVKPGIDLALEEGRKAWEESRHDAVIATKLYRARLRAIKSELDPAVFRYDQIDANGIVFRTADASAPGNSKGSRYSVPHPVTGKECAVPLRGWRWTESRLRQEVAAGNVIFGSDHTTQPQVKRNLVDVKTQVPYPTFTQTRMVGSNHVANIIGAKQFDFPKDHTVLARWFRMAAPKDAKILDFFGGSGSTAEAVLALNAEDGGTREVTIVTNDENNIGTTITRERIVRVMTGENWADGKPHEGYGGRLGLWNVGISRAVDFSSTADEGLHHSWNVEAGKWGAWQNTPLLHRADDYYDVYTDGCGEYSLVFHDIDHLKGSLVDEALGEFPDAQVFLPYQHAYKHSHGFYVDDVPNAIPLPLGVVSPIQNGVADSMLTPYIKRGGGSYLDRIAALTGLSDDDRED